MKLALDDAGRGDCVVLIHGHPFDRTLWQPQIAAFSSAYHVVAFDPLTVHDTATYQEPVAFPKGVEQVLVGGQPVVTRGESLDAARPGRVIRG